MIAVSLGLISAWVVLRLCGVTRRWPWRVADLARPVVAGADVDRPPRALRRTPTRGSSSTPRSTRGRVRAIERDLPATIDLLAVAVSAGHTLEQAVAAVGDTRSGPVADALDDVASRVERGASLPSMLEQLPLELGAVVRPLVTTLSVTAASGAAVGPALARLSEGERRRIRRRGEVRARRLPVLMLGPLVGLVLPAFVLLTVVPVALSTAGSGLIPTLAVVGT